jgi:hypothetical protein
MSGSLLCSPRNEILQPRYFQNRIIMFCLPIPTLIYLWEIYMFPGSVCLFAAAKYVDRSWEHRSQTHDCRNWDWGRAIPFRGMHKFDFRSSEEFGPNHSIRRQQKKGGPLSILYSSTVYRLNSKIISSEGFQNATYNYAANLQWPLTLDRNVSVWNCFSRPHWYKKKEKCPHI